VKHVVIIGVGALGSHLVQFLRNEPIQLRVVDFDIIEAKNTLAQFHTKGNIRRGKAASLKQLMQFLWNVKIESNGNRLAAHNLRELIHGPIADLVIDCVDNAATRQLIQDHVRAYGVPCLHGALAADGTFGRVCWDDRFVIDAEAATGTPTCEDGAHLPFIGLVSTHLAYAAQRFLRDGCKIGFQISPGGSIAV